MKHFVPIGCLALAALGCFTDEEGRSPDPTRFYYPTGMLTSPGQTTLYVANSDFDLRYAGGWVQALDLVAIRNAMRVIPETIAAGGTAAQACQAAGLGPNPSPWLDPGPCDAFEAVPFVRSHAFIGAFASDLVLAHEPGGARARLFVSVRGDPSITYFEVEDDRSAPPGSPAASFRLECEVGGDGFCGAAHRLGQDRESTLRGIRLPADPLGMATSSDGEAIVTAHPTQAAASLVHNDWQAPRPVLTYFIPNLPPGPTEITPIPVPAFAQPLLADAASGFAYQPGFALTFRASAEIDFLRFFTDSGSNAPRPFLVRALAAPVTTNATGFDSRGVVITDAERRACESACGGAVEPELGACLVACAEAIPMRIYMANRTPPSLLVGRVHTKINRVGEGMDEVVASADEEVFFHETIPLNLGASQVELGQVVTEDGQLEERVFAVCFDARTIAVFDPRYERVESWIRTGRGPHDVAFHSGVDADGPFSYLLVGHFTDSYLGVVDLDRRRPLTYGQMVASIGRPTPPRESN